MKNKKQIINQNVSYTEQEIAFIITKRDEGKLSWIEIADKFNKKFHSAKSWDWVRKIYDRYKQYYLTNDNQVKTLKEIHRTKKTNSYTSKENKAILQCWNERDDLLQAIKDSIHQISLTKYKPPKITYKKSSKLEKMSLELLVSDVHFGKLVKDVSGNVLVDACELRKRMCKLGEQVIKEINRNRKDFNVEKIIIAILGDLIESNEIHGAESVKACEFSTARQIFEAINSLFYDILLPIAMTGIVMEICCVCGNHDRPSQNQTYVRRGEENNTYIIYKTLELLCKERGLTNITFNITPKIYTYTTIYNNVILYEHGDELKNLNRDTLRGLMNKRQNQINKVVDFYRTGHWHETFSYGRGEMIGNGCVPGQDDYSESKGFNSEALQVLNSYVMTDKRRTCFFRSFPIFLEEIK